MSGLPVPPIARRLTERGIRLNTGSSMSNLADFYREFPRYDPKAGFPTDPGVRDGICLAGRRHCFIDATGNVYPYLAFKAASDRS
jgi:hypothetical protein